MTIVETQGMTGHAPGWKIRCTKCGTTKDAEKAGVVRVGGWAPAGKLTLGWCTKCRRLRLACIYQDKTAGNEPDRS